MTFGKVASLILTCAALAGCGEIGSFKARENPATVTAVSEQNLALRFLPPPSQKVTISVYGLPDLTGQYRERENTQSLSRAVSQGGGQMLIAALQNAGENRWFSILDRTNLDDLLRERQIATEMRRLYQGEASPDPTAVPPLRHSGIIIQGAIVGYDSNTQTGGFGARYLGIGGDSQWKLDVVTISLRAVATSTGEVLANVMVEKPIASTSLRGGVFSYVELDKLIESEAGVAANEPKQMALQMAVEKAVTALIFEGADAGIWSFADRQRAAPLLRQYREEKYRGTAISPDRPTVAPPMTTNPANVIETQPGARVARSVPAVQQRQLAPVQHRSAPPAEVPPPPPAGDDEVVG
ncbi:MAG: CsgG/HfaB family protein [Paracoccaceae bacterium]